MTTSRTPFRIQRLPQSIGENETDLQIGAAFPITGDGMNLRIDLRVSGVVVASGISIEVQDSLVDDGAGEPLWRDVGGLATTVTTDGLVSLNSGSSLQSSGPLGSIARLIVTTGAGDELVVEEVRTIQA
jgi:hypothetical protein